MREAVGGGQIFKLETGQTVLAPRPFDAFRTQTVRHARQIDDVPARIAFLPLAFVRIEEISIQQIAGEFVVEADGVETDAARTRHRQFFVHARSEVGFNQSFALDMLRRDAGDETRQRPWQNIRREFAIKTNGFADRFEIQCRADSRELRRPIAPRIDTECFVVVPEKTCCVHARRLSRRQLRTVSYGSRWRKVRPVPDRTRARSGY